MKVVWLVAGLALTALAVAGAMLPGLPSTVFALGAVACFARSSPRLEAWLVGHPWFGPSIRAWRAERAIPTSAKIVALSSMATSGVFLALTAPVPVAVGVGALLVASAAYVGTRPAPDPSRLAASVAR